MYFAINCPVWSSVLRLCTPQSVVSQLENTVIWRRSSSAAFCRLKDFCCQAGKVRESVFLHMVNYHEYWSWPKMCNINIGLLCRLVLHLYKQRVSHWSILKNIVVKKMLWNNVHFIFYWQRVSIACYAERCLSYDRFCLTVRHSPVSCQNDSSYDHAVFTGG